MEYATSATSFLTGPGFVSQLMLTVVALLVFYLVVTAIETVVNFFKKMDQQTTVLFADTTPGKQVVVQDPSAGSPTIYNSENEVHGMEFSYSMYLFINPETFEASVSDSCGVTTNNDAKKLKHIFHKGSKDGFPLMAPGLFVEGDKNTLRLYMNSTTQWNNYVEIPNIPIGKWFHIVISLKGQYLDVYINGNVTVRHQFNTVPKLNFGNVFVLYPLKFPTGDASTVDAKFKVDNAAKGMVSRLKYYAYALNYSQIDALYREGPSKKIVSSSYTEIPPYLHDDWWVTKY